MTVVALEANTSRIEKRSNKNWLRQYYRDHAFAIHISALVTLLLIVAGWPFVVVTVPAGFVGVKYYRFAGGTNIEAVYSEGSHLKWPWDKMAQYEVRLQRGSRSFDVLTRDGLMVTAIIATRFRLQPSSVAWLHKHIGPNYMETLIVPAVGSYARLVISRNSTDELYSARRGAIQDEIKRAVAADISTQTQSDRGTPTVLLDDVLILGIRFPPAVQAAIDRKMEQYQLREEYAYRIQREELETRRKEIEARGIAQFQSIVGAGISDNYLRWKSIDATLSLAQSSNSKVVVLGNNKENVPLFLGGEDGRATPSPPAPPPAHPPSADVRAQTPLSGPPAPPSEQAKETDEKSWASGWILSIRGLLAPRHHAPVAEDSPTGEEPVAAGDAP
jgi:regulator of protease activity HflC (stomatin/prohibitin superfamily)